MLSILLLSLAANNAEPQAVLAKVRRPVADLTLPGLRQRLKTDAAGTRVRLKVRSGGAEREFVLTLRDLV